LVLWKTIGHDQRLYMGSRHLPVAYGSADEFARMFMLPMALLNLVTAGVWRFTARFLGWFVCALRWSSRMFWWAADWRKAWRLKEVYRFAE
jgi:hypothetical protein